MAAEESLGRTPTSTTHYITQWHYHIRATGATLFITPSPGHHLSQSTSFQQCLHLLERPSPCRLRLPFPCAAWAAAVSTSASLVWAPCP